MLRLPDGLEVVGDEWFRDCAVEKVVVPSSVRELGKSAFAGCRRLREVVFERDSLLELVGDFCFSECGLREVVVPRSVRRIGEGAFCGCLDLASLRFEEGSRLSSIGERAFRSTRLRPENVEYPSALQTEGYEW